MSVENQAEHQHSSMPKAARLAVARKSLSIGMQMQPSYCKAQLQAQTWMTTSTIMLTGAQFRSGGRTCQRFLVCSHCRWVLRSIAISN